jgi:hypothetical protein
MDTLMGLLRRLGSQDVARTNAAQASVRLQHRRRQLEDVEAFLAGQRHRPPARFSGNWPQRTMRAGRLRHDRG